MATTIWKGHLSFGLVAIPVKLYRAARPEKVGFHQLYRAPSAANEPAPEQPSPPQKTKRSSAADRIVTPLALEQPAPEPPLSRIRQAAYVPESDEGPRQPVNRNDLVRGYEYERGQYVVVSDDDLRRITPETRKEMQILEFVHFAEIDPVFLESSYYVVPDNGGEKAYALLFEALRQSGYAALAELAMHRREHVVIIRPGGKGLIAHTMYYASEVRAEEEFRTDTGLVKPKELEMAKLLVESLAGKFEPGRYHDKWRERLEALIQERVEGREVTPAAEAPKEHKVVDIMEALQKSLAAARKPASSETPAPSARKRSGRG